MSKKERVQITADTIDNFIKERDDFQLEVDILNMCRLKRLEVKHAGTYQDPTLGKDRQFDIRAKIPAKNGSQVMLAIECKNLSCALLVSRMPREMEEAFHEILVFTWSATATSARRILRDGDNHSHYIRGEMVGKSVVRFPPKGSDQSNDVYDGWSQAVQSAASFLWEESPKIRADQGQQRGAAVVPFLIVADGSLWVVDYDKTGARIGPSMMVDHCEVFIGKQICSNRPVEYGHQWNYTMSHLEIFTKTGFQKFMNTDLSEWANRLVMPVIQGRV